MAASTSFKGYGCDECLEDYRLAVLYYLVYAFIIIGALDPTNQRGMAPFNVLVERVG